MVIKIDNNDPIICLALAEWASKTIDIKICELFINYVWLVPNDIKIPIKILGGLDESLSEILSKSN
jgi:hypothetical protein